MLHSVRRLLRRAATAAARRQARTLAPGTRFRLSVPDLSHPVTLRAGGSDLRIFKQIYLRGELDFPLPDAPVYIVDAGANIGLSAVCFAARFPEARVVALEVDAANFALLEENARPYGGRITPLRLALWSGRGRVAITNPGDEAWAFRVAELAGSPAGAGDAVDAIGVTGLLEQLGLPRVDLLKLDIEGAELEVFSGATRWLDRVGTIAVELHDRLRPGCSAAMDAALAGRAHRRTRSGEYVVVSLD